MFYLVYTLLIIWLHAYKKWHQSQGGGEGEKVKVQTSTTKKDTMT